MATPNPPHHSGSAAHRIETQISYSIGAPLIYVRGDLDHDTAGELRAAIDEELAGRPANMALDLSDVSYIDSAGLTLLFDIMAKFSPPGWLGVVNPNSSVRRLLEITGLPDRASFRVFADVHSAGKAVIESNPD